MNRLVWHAVPCSPLALYRLSANLPSLKDVYAYDICIPFSFFFFLESAFIIRNMRQHVCWCTPTGWRRMWYIYTRGAWDGTCVVTCYRAYINFNPHKLRLSSVQVPALSIITIATSWPAQHSQDRASQCQCQPPATLPLATPKVSCK